MLLQCRALASWILHSIQLSGNHFVDSCLDAGHGLAGGGGSAVEKIFVGPARAGLGEGGERDVHGCGPVGEFGLDGSIK